MLNNVELRLTAGLINLINRTKGVLRCEKGTSNELLTAIGLISITVGVLSVVSPTIRTTIQQVTTDALNAAATLFRTTTGGR